MTRSHYRALALAGLAALGASVTLSAAIVQPATIQQRAHGAQRVVVASVVDTTANYQRNQFGDNLIVTHARLAIEEAILARSPTIVYTVMVDKNGYLPTHNQRYSQPLTGNLAVDLVNNRTKRIFNDRTGLAAARSVAPFLVQRYQRDTGEIMADISVPVMLRGTHWGAVRIGYRAVDGR